MIFQINQNPNIYHLYKYIPLVMNLKVPKFEISEFGNQLALLTSQLLRWQNGLKEAAAKSFRNKGSSTSLLNRKKQLGKMAPVKLDLL